MNTNTTPRRLALLLCSAVVVAAAPAAVALDAPRPLNARFAAPPAADPARAVEILVREGVERAWLGYAVPIVAGDHEMCCSVNGLAGVCPLDGHDGIHIDRHDEFRTARRAPDSLAVFVRLRPGGVSEVRIHSGDCAVDAGGATYYALDDVDPAQSVAFLAPLVESWTGDVSEGALAALAMHAAEEAATALERFTAPSRPEELRAQAAFWIGIGRGAEGLGLLTRLLREDPSPEVREKVVFAIYAGEAPAASGMLIDVAREDESPDVRKAALFWLGQLAGERAAGELRDAVTRDPDAEVREAAVFALSQLPADESVPALIEIARGSRHAEVRRMATFWLGQSDDARALEFFEELLGR